MRPWFVVILIAAPVLGDPPEPAVVNAVADIYRAFPSDTQKFGGVIGTRLRANSEGYIEHAAKPQGGTIAGQPGGFIDNRGTLLDAAAYTFEYNRDASVNSVMAVLAKGVISSQGADGYVGTRPEGDKWTEQDTWNQSSALTGLLHYYAVTGDQSALSGCTRLADLLVKERRRSGNESVTFAGALQPMANLFRYTDKNSYLEFCNAVAEAWLHKKPPELTVTQQNLEVLNGLVELHRISGETSIFAAPVRAWTEMQAAGFTLTGVPSDLSVNPQALDACVTDAWLRLSLSLYRVTGQSVYSEQLERTVYNQLFAGQDPKTGKVLAPVAWAGKKDTDHSTCAANEVRALAMLPQAVWGRYGNGLVVNLYTDGRTTVKLRRRGTIQLYTEANYPESGTVLLHVEPDHPTHFPLRLRVPDWTGKFTADVDEDHFVGKPGEYLIINRGWKRGDTIKISIAMSTRLIPGARQFSSDVAIARGPQVLALGVSLNPGIDLAQASVSLAESNGVALAPVATNYAANWMGEQAYAVEGVYAGQPRKLILVPFADALDYRVWLAQSSASRASSR